MSTNWTTDRPTEPGEFREFWDSKDNGELVGFVRGDGTWRYA